MRPGEIKRRYANSLFTYIGLIVLLIWSIPHLKPDVYGFVAIAILLINFIYNAYDYTKKLIVINRIEKSMNVDKLIKQQTKQITNVMLDEKFIEGKTKNIFVYIWAIELIAWVNLECNPQGFLQIVLFFATMYATRCALESYHMIQFVKRKKQEEESS